MRKDVPKATGRPASLETQIRELLGQPQHAPMDLPELAHLLGVGRDQHRLLQDTLARMERAGQIARLKQGNRFGLPSDADLVPGRIRMNRQGVGTLQPDYVKAGTIRISSDATATAIHGDRVLVRRDAVPPRRGVPDLGTSYGSSCPDPRAGAQ